MSAYYNENDPFAAAWLRELIKAKLIADGEVDERSIEDVQVADLKGFTQCHFFAGIGVWSYALRLAGWPDDRPVWTGSCPCPSFSAAGKGEGFEDPRHLWPCWFGLIRESRPATIFGEQADKAIGFGWLDLVQTDLEAEGYAVGATVLGAHSVGAPHRRQRLYFVADPSSERIRTARLGSVDEAPAGMQRTIRQRERLRADSGEYGATLSGSQSASGRCGSRQSGESLFGKESCGETERSSHALIGSESLHAERRSPNEHRENGRDGQDYGRTETHSIAGTCSEVFERTDADGGNANSERLQRSGEHGLRTENGRSTRSTGNDEWTETGDRRVGARHERDGESNRLAEDRKPSTRRSIINGADSQIDRTSDETEARESHTERIGPTGERINAEINGRERQSLFTNGEPSQRIEEASQSGDMRDTSTAGYGSSVESAGSTIDSLAGDTGDIRDWRGPGWLDSVAARSASEAGATRGFWGDCDWWYGKDGKYRPIGPGLFPLVTGAPARVGQLRGYGNAIIPQVAQGLIEAYMSITEEG